jgi:hypothetical protein
MIVRCRHLLKGFERIEKNKGTVEIAIAKAHCTLLNLFNHSLYIPNDCNVYKAVMSS